MRGENLVTFVDRRSPFQSLSTTRGYVRDYVRIQGAQETCKGRANVAKKKKRKTACGEREILVETRGHNTAPALFATADARWS